MPKKYYKIIKIATDSIEGLSCDGSFNREGYKLVAVSKKDFDIICDMAMKKLFQI